MVLTLQHITHRYGELEILRDVSLSVKEGERIALVGPSGSGKTTLLQLAGLLDTPTSGTIAIAGKETTSLSEEKSTLLRREAIGFVYQFHHLLPEFSALENVRMPLRIAGQQDKDKRAQALLERVGLNERISHRPGELSGGERQRVAICRALIHSPKLVLADEPTGNLDEAKADEVFALLTELAKETGAGVVVATHNLELAAQLDVTYRLHLGRLEKI